MMGGDVTVVSQPGKGSVSPCAFRATHCLDQHTGQIISGRPFGNAN
jgi:hypothetical protein